jgi:hypothetical protein
MSKKHKQSGKATKSLKRTKIAPQPEEEPDTATQSASAEAPQAAPAIPAADIPEVPVESQQADAAPAEAAGSETAAKTTGSVAAKANIKEGLRLHQIAGRPTLKHADAVSGSVSPYFR